MSKKVKFTDSVNFEPVFDQKLKDFYQDPSQQLQSLRVRVAATHAGKITRNNGFYLPHRMREGAATFTAQYPKPIQVHHDNQKDPVGRVVSARYVDVSQGLMDAWDGRKICDDKRPIQDELLQNFCQGQLSDSEMVDIANQYFIQDESIIDDPDYQGLGYIELTADITDPDAIRKVLDRRYLTGSIGASTDSATCSVCKQDWAGEDGPCEHRPGKVYDGKKCVLIAGSLEYEEWSFVNSPADTHSAVIAVDGSGGVHDSVEMEESMGKTEDVALEILDHTQEEKSKEETNMLELKDKKQEDQPAPPTDEVKDEVQTEEDPKTSEADLQVEDSEPQTETGDNPPADSVEDDASGATDTTTDATVEDEADAEEDSDVEDKKRKKKKTKCEKEESEDEEEIKDGADVVDAVKEFFGDGYDDIVGEDEEGRHYAEMLHYALTDEEAGLSDEDKAELQDKKLTSKGRKALSKGTFCKPGERKYPVPDCSHAKSAMAYAKKYNESSSVIACIRRKAKRLGCPFQDMVVHQEQDANVGKYTIEYFDAMDDEELIQLLAAARAALKERELDCPDCLEEEAKLQERVDALETEVKFLLEDSGVLNSQLADLVKVNRELKVEKINDFNQLSGKGALTEERLVELKDAKTDELDKILNDLAGQVDISKIADTINSGLSNNPQGTVENPVAVLDQQQEKQGEVKLDRATLEKIRDQYFALSFRSQVLADKFLADLQARGILPKEGFQIEDKS